MNIIKPSLRNEPQGSTCSDSNHFLSWLIIFSARNGEPRTPQQLCRRRVPCSAQRLDPTQQPIFDPGQEVIIPDAILRKQLHIGIFLSLLARSRSNSGRKGSPGSQFGHWRECFTPFFVPCQQFLNLINKFDCFS